MLGLSGGKPSLRAVAAIVLGSKTLFHVGFWRPSVVLI